MGDSIILENAAASRKILRMALQVAERNLKEAELILVGIKENGIHIAHQIEQALKEVYKGKTTVISLSLNKNTPGDITLSDDLNLTNKIIILVDDVANSGRTMMYALKPILKFHPKKVETLALVERMHKQFPIHLNYVGLSIITTPDEHIEVVLHNGQVTHAAIHTK